MKQHRFKPEREGKDGWTRWVQPRPRGYLMECCDCGLVHRMDFRVAGTKIQMRAQRAERYTAQRRKKRNIFVRASTVRKHAAAAAGNKP